MIRSKDGSIEVAWVPRSQLRPALVSFKDAIYTGIEKDDSIKLGEIIVDLFKGDTRLGVIYEIEPFEPIGSWFSDIRFDKEQDCKYITIFGLSGRYPNKWAENVFQLVEEWAQLETCKSYRWYGRPGWVKYVGEAQLVEMLPKSREGLFEKVIER